jgi:hypothetical protein
MCGCIHVCMSACMCACMHVCMYACVHVCMLACMQVYMCACMHVCMYVCMYACKHVCSYVSMQVCIGVCGCACMYVCMANIRSHGEIPPVLRQYILFCATIFTNTCFCSHVLRRHAMFAPLVNIRVRNLNIRAWHPWNPWVPKKYIHAHGWGLHVGITQHL